MSKETDPFRIVVGHDLTSKGNEALEEAIALARRLSGAEVHVVHALARPSRTNATANERRLADALELLKEQVRHAVQRDPSVRTHAHVCFGNVTDTILQVAIDYDAAMVLVGTHGRRGPDRVARRSVAERLVRTAPLPVLVAHAKDFEGLPLTAHPDHPSTHEEPQRPRALTELVSLPERVATAAGRL